MHKKANIRSTLLAWMQERDVSANGLARATGVPQPTISRILKGQSKDPDTATLQPIATWFGRTVAELRGESVSDSTLAENAAGYARLPKGAAIARIVPVITWGQAADWRGPVKDTQHPDHFPCPAECSEDTFALRVEGISMEPKFHAGEIIFVDRNAPTRHDCYVVALLPNETMPALRRLLLEGGHAYLHSLNPGWPAPIVKVDDDVRIVGVVIFKGEPL